LAVGGGLALCFVLVWWWRGPVGETVPAARPEISTPVPAPLPVAAVNAVDASGLVLRGVMLRGGGSSAIIERADGRQQLVRRGGMVMPGVRLLKVVPGGVELGLGALGAGRLVLRLDAEGAAPVAAKGADRGDVVRARPQELAASVSAWRLALVAKNEGGRITGWVVRDVSQVPVLRLAGLVPGDVLLAVNEQPLFSEEKVMELPDEVAGAYAVVLDYSRDGRAARARIDLKR